MNKRLTTTIEPVVGTNHLRVTVPEIGASCETLENSLDAITEARNRLIIERELAEQKPRTRQRTKHKAS
jgi:hypothetical protein